MKSIELKNTAIEMRKIGNSYEDIMRVIPVSKSTLSKWMSGTDFTLEEKAYLDSKILKGREISRTKAALTIRQKRIDRENRVISEALREFEQYKKDPLFFTGICLYWAEGAKKHTYFQFVNSDSDMVSLMIKWIEKFLQIDRSSAKYRLFIHQLYANENCEEYWSSIVKVPVSKFYKTIYKPTLHKVKKNPSYKGCFRIDIARIDILRKVKAWQKLLIRYYEEIQ
jgi:hypothetical protein